MKSTPNGLAKSPLGAPVGGVQVASLCAAGSDSQKPVANMCAAGLDSQKPATSRPAAAADAPRPCESSSAGQPESRQTASAISPANRLGLDYRRAPGRRFSGPITDVHTHVRGVGHARLYIDVARHYGVTRIVSMTPLAEVDAMRAAYGDVLRFIAVPDWSKQAATDEFQAGWMRDLETFRGKGACICKFWMAPRMREKHGLTLDHPFMKCVVRHAHGLGYHFMTHIGDPSAWWESQYKDAAKFGTKRDQFRQLDWLLSEFPDRTVIGAHMGGSIEELDFLDGLLERFPNYVIDTSATKWIVRGVASQPDAVREFMIRRQDRILFGSDVVVGEKYDFDHYASRYWCQQMMWETAYRGESPIEDPDAGASPRLAGVDLPAEALEKVYRGNYDRLFGATER